MPKVKSGRFNTNIVKQVELLNGRLERIFDGIAVEGKKATKELAEAIMKQSQQYAPVRVVRYDIIREGQPRTVKMGHGWARKSDSLTREEALLEVKAGKGKYKLAGNNKPQNLYRMVRGQDASNRSRSVLAKLTGGHLKASAYIEPIEESDGKVSYRVYYDTRKDSAVHKGTAYNYAIVQHERYDFKHAIGQAGFLRRAYLELKDAGVRKIRAVIKEEVRRGGK